MPSKEQLDRVAKVNELMKFMSDLERGKKLSNFFFCAESLKGNKNNYAFFEFFDLKLYYVDAYTEKRIYPYNSVGKHKGFTNGGTIWALVNDMREWIITGKQTDGKNGYGGLYCTQWAMGLEAKEKVIAKAKEIGYLHLTQSSFEDYCKELVRCGALWSCEKYMEEINKKKTLHPSLH